MNFPDNLIKMKDIVGEASFIFTRKHYINLISSLIVWLSCIMFILQYFEKPFIKIIFYSIAFLLLILIIERTDKFYNLLLTKNTLFLLMLILTAAAILLYRLGYIGYPSIGGFTILWLLIIYHSQNVKTSLIQLAVFLLSPVLYSEMISFSGSFSLVMLVIISIFISERYLDNKRLDWKFFLAVFLFGVTLSAQMIVSFIYLIYLQYKFRNHVTKGSIFVLVNVSSIYFVILFSR